MLLQNDISHFLTAPEQMEILVLSQFIQRASHCSYFDSCGDMPTFRSTLAEAFTMQQQV